MTTDDRPSRPESSAPESSGFPWGLQYRHRREVSARYPSVFSIPIERRPRDVLLRNVDDGMRVLDVGAMTVITDYMIIVTGRSARQVKALSDRVREAVAKHKHEGVSVIGSEGEAQGEWVLLDLGDVIVHIMQPEAREFYQLEKLWEKPARMRAQEEENRAAH